MATSHPAGARAIDPKDLDGVCVRSRQVVRQHVPQLRPPPFLSQEVHHKDSLPHPMNASAAEKRLEEKLRSEQRTREQLERTLDSGSPSFVMTLQVSFEKSDLPRFPKIESVNQGSSKKPSRRLQRWRRICSSFGSQITCSFKLLPMVNGMQIVRTGWSESGSRLSCWLSPSWMSWSWSTNPSKSSRVPSKRLFCFWWDNVFVVVAGCFIGCDVGFDAEASCVPKRGGNAWVT